MKLRLISVMIAVAALCAALPAAAQSPTPTARLDQGLAAAERGDYTTAYRLWKPLAEQGDAGAQRYLGTMYDKGHGVARDHDAAVRWYRKAAEQGDASAQSMLAFMYYNGAGVPQDYAVAAGWWRKAAEQGDDLAQYFVGIIYLDGKVGLQDYVQAHKWFNLGAASGNTDALKARDSVAAKMTPAQIAEAQRLASAWTVRPAN